MNTEPETTPGTDADESSSTTQAAAPTKELPMSTATVVAHPKGDKITKPAKVVKTAKEKPVKAKATKVVKEKAPKPAKVKAVKPAKVAKMPKPAKVAKEKAPKAAGEGKRGRVSAFAGKKIYKLVSKNPRREGTAGFASFALITNGMKYESYIEKGGRSGDLAFDVAHKYVEVK